MIIYNVTIKVDWSIHEAWLRWMKEEHMPEVLATGLFEDSRLLRLLETDDTDGPTYAAQYFTSSETHYRRYIAEHAQALRQKGLEKWGDRFVAFRSVMEVVK